MTVVPSNENESPLTREWRGRTVIIERQLAWGDIYAVHDTEGRRATLRGRDLVKIPF